MVQLCSKCSRPNPPEASYCYHDGFALGGHGGSGPVAVGSQAFVSPFVFPSGRSCRSFNELALACQEEWKAARDLFKQGYLETFFGNIGRVDLVMSAREAGRFPDADRGLDMLLTVLPTDVMEPPRLRVEPQDVSLGIVDDEKDRTVELRLENQGMRLLYGSVVSDVPWLTLGESGTVNEKRFQCLNDVTIPVKVVNAHLRAGNKPAEGKLVVDTNGGNFTVFVRAERPVKPFPSGVLAGCKLPRHIAAKAQEASREATQAKREARAATGAAKDEALTKSAAKEAVWKELIAQFENGAVAAWYRSNGWPYPIQGPAAPGMAAVQQYLEALGLTLPPKTVEISATALDLSGMPGDELTASLSLTTPEKKVVYGVGLSDQPWLSAEQARLNGQTATLPVKVRVPDKPGEKLNAVLTVNANGNKRFRVAVTLQVGGVPILEVPPPEPDVEPVTLPDVSPFEAIDEPEPVAAAAVGTVAAIETFAELDTAATAVLPEPEPQTVMARLPQRSALVQGPARYRRKQGVPLWMHLAPAAGLVLAVGLVVAVDLFTRDGKPAQASGEPDNPPDNPNGGGGTSGSGGSGGTTTAGSNLPGTWTLPKTVDLKNPRLLYRLNTNEVNTNSFGLVLTEEHDPTNPNNFKKLTYEENGRGNSLRVRINGLPHKFGFTDNQDAWEVKRRDLALPRIGSWSVEKFRGEDIRVTQHIEIVYGPTKKLDTCLVIYTIENYGDLPRKVGLRLMMDTYIGANDGVPFAIPGRPDFVRDSAVLEGEQVPAYVEAVEDPDNPKNPGTVARMVLHGLKVPRSMLVERYEATREDPDEVALEGPEKVVISAWPAAGSGAEYDYAIEPILKPGARTGDSSIGLFWEDKELGRGKKRTLGFTYGLSDMKIEAPPPDPTLPPNETPKPVTAIALRGPAQVSSNQEFIVSAYVWNAKQGQKVDVNLPDGLSLADGEQREKTVTSGDGKRFKIDWRVKAAREGAFKVGASSDKASTTFEVVVKDKSIFG